MAASKELVEVLGPLTETAPDRYQLDLAGDIDPGSQLHLAIALHDLAERQLKRDGGTQDALEAIREGHEAARGTPMAAPSCCATPTPASPTCLHVDELTAYGPIMGAASRTSHAVFAIKRSRLAGTGQVRPLT